MVRVARVKGRCLSEFSCPPLVGRSDFTMTDYTFLKTPTHSEIARLTQLYRQAGWWNDEADNPSVVAGIVSGSHCFLVARQ